MTKICMYCDKEVTWLEHVMGYATKTIHGLYVHNDCVNYHRKESVMSDQNQHILGAADSAHQAIELAISLLQESMGNMGEILTQGCVALGPASLGSTMRLGQKLKVQRFILADLLVDARGLCILLGHNLGVCEDEPQTLGDLVDPPDSLAQGLFRRCSSESDDFEPGEDEFDDDEIPF